MKIVRLTLGDTPDGPARDGWVILNYSDPRGGRTSVGAKMTAGMTWGEVAAVLATNMTAAPWPDFVKVKLQGNALRLACPDELDKVVFYAEFNPSPTQVAPHEAADFAVIEDEGF